MQKIIEVSEIAGCIHLGMLKQPIIGHPTLHVQVDYPGKYIFVAVEEGRIKLCCPHCFRIATTAQANFLN